MNNKLVRSPRITFRHKIVMFLLLCISGNPVFVYADTKWLFVIFAFLMAAICFYYRKRLVGKGFIRWLVLTILLFATQMLLLDVVSIPADVNFLSRLWIAYLAASFFGLHFREVYLKVIVFISLVSIPLFLLNALGVSFGIEVNRYYTILVYNQILPSVFNPEVRNSGMFWEPGAFQGYLLLVPLLYYNNLEFLWKKKRKEILILFVAFLLTQSTTAYLTLAVFLLLTVLSSKKLALIYKVFIVSSLSVLFVSFLWSQSFIGDKITKQLEEAQHIEKGEANWDRMGAMKVDMFNIARHPIIGNGFDEKSKYGSLSQSMKGAGNGLSGSMNMMGIPFILCYLFALTRLHPSLSVSRRAIIPIVVALLLYGEYFLNYPMFWALLFIKIPKNENNCSFAYSAQSKG